MSGDKDLIYLHHILECIEVVEGYTAKGKDDFFNNTLVQDGVLRRLQIMAESTQRLSDRLKAQAPNVDWRALSGFRNILVHDYLGGISLSRVWDAVENNLPILKQEVQLMLNDFGKGEV
ncbi:MAG: DUF86 domain-containing protein [Cyanobacteria bacterium]|nr:DUF86 domain-containing protein [Cyanobacteria bacterium CG_2015-16_32_12]NCO77468.1 DUF86 domain-containing protein [Cyanobacteria bacterium CG_2015-22_32_23]NCQ04061.1 DUF86 domain-containing protein [Cyanobacteria bacterium CG_2015-09_32_10]NCQ42416.1 DUF86 domain-containing protein [Cyanobacteria bacterium CG_2015-04_32_10]NCS84071.1 DUF86 domain-containing protein [Cyanobacteria bacterium CG_2015-02_32_10]